MVRILAVFEDGSVSDVSDLIRVIGFREKNILCYSKKSVMERRIGVRNQQLRKTECLPQLKVFLQYCANFSIHQDSGKQKVFLAE